jgi:hypothetical protein
MEAGCEDGRWMELAQNRAQWLTLVLAALKLLILLPENHYNNLRRRHETVRTESVFDPFRLRLSTSRISMCSLWFLASVALYPLERRRED